MKATDFTFKVEIFIFLFQENYFKTQRKRYTKGQSKRKLNSYLNTTNKTPGYMAFLVNCTKDLKNTNKSTLKLSNLISNSLRKQKMGNTSQLIL